MNSYADQITDLGKQPETVDEAVKQLMFVLNDEQKAEIAAVAKEDLFELHFTLGLAIRNAFGLHDPDSKLLADTGYQHPDDASGLVIQTLWETENNIF